MKESDNTLKIFVYEEFKVKVEKETPDIVFVYETPVMIEYVITDEDFKNGNWTRGPDEILNIFNLVKATSN